MSDPERTISLRLAEIAKQAASIQKSLDLGIIKQAQEAAKLTKSLDLNAVTEATQRWRSAFVEPQVLKGIQDTMVVRPFLPPSFTTVISDWQKNSQAIAESIQSIGKAWQATVQSSLAPFQQVFARIAEERKKAELVEQTGWLPHYTTPFHLIDVDESDVAAANEAIATHYAEAWDEVEGQFLENLDGYQIDNEAKATFREALSAHRHGLYRAVPRTLFPEIERVASNEIYGGKRTITEQTPKGKLKAFGITSLPGVSEAARDLPAGELLSYEFGMNLFTKMEEHLYARVGEDAAEISKFANDPVPNRHASLHGIISYSSRQTSLNALMMTDFMFHLISKMKSYIADESEGDEDGDAAVKES